MVKRGKPNQARIRKGTHNRDMVSPQAGPERSLSNSQPTRGMASDQEADQGKNNLETKKF